MLDYPKFIESNRKEEDLSIQSILNKLLVMVVHEGIKRGGGQFFSFFFAFSTKLSLTSMTLVTMVTRCHFEILRLVLLFVGHTCFTHKE